jgi:hypothetical protein
MFQGGGPGRSSVRSVAGFKVSLRLRALDPNGHADRQQRSRRQPPDKPPPRRGAPRIKQFSGAPSHPGQEGATESLIRIALCATVE